MANPGPATVDAESRVLVTDYPGPDFSVESGVLKASGLAITLAPSTDEDALVEAAGAGVDAIFACYARVTPGVMAASDRVKVISRSGIGVDNVDVQAATERGIIVSNVDGYCIDEVAEHTIALLLASARRIPMYDRAVRAGTWSVPFGAPIRRIRGQVVGVVGLGAIGRAVARRAAGLGLELLAHDPFLTGSHPDAPAVPLVTLDELLAASDFVTLHLPLTTGSRHLIDARALSLMKPSAHLINTSRGGIVDLEALEAALRDGTLAGAALDVVEREPLGPTSTLLELQNVTVTPHAAFYSEESIVELRTRAAQNIVDVLAGRRPAAVVNREVLERPEWLHLRSSTARVPAPR